MITKPTKQPIRISSAVCYYSILIYILITTISIDLEAQSSKINIQFTKNLLTGNRDSISYYAKKGADLKCIIDPAEGTCVEFASAGLFCIILGDTASFTLLRKFGIDKDSDLREHATSMAIQLNDDVFLNYLIKAGYPLTNLVSDEHPFQFAVTAPASVSEFKDAFSTAITNMIQGFKIKKAEIKRKPLTRIERDQTINFKIIELLIAKSKREVIRSANELNLIELLANAEWSKSPEKLKLTKKLLTLLPELTKKNENFIAAVKLAVLGNDPDYISSLVEKNPVQVSAENGTVIIPFAAINGTSRQLDLLKRKGFRLDTDYDLIECFYSNSFNPDHKAFTDIMVGNFEFVHNAGYRFRDERNIIRFFTNCEMDPASTQNLLNSILKQQKNDGLYSELLVTSYKNKCKPLFENLFKLRAGFKNVAYDRLVYEACLNVDKPLLDNLMLEIKDPLSLDLNNIPNFSKNVPRNVREAIIHYYSILLLRVPLLYNGFYYKTRQELDLNLAQAEKEISNTELFGGTIRQRFKTPQGELTRSSVVPETHGFYAYPNERLKRTECITVENTKEPNTYKHLIRSNLDWVDQDIFILYQPIRNGYRYYYNITGSVDIPSYPLNQPAPLSFSRVKVTNSSLKAEIMVSQSGKFIQIKPTESFIVDRTAGVATVSYNNIEGTEVDIVIDLTFNLDKFADRYSPDYLDELAAESGEKFDEETRLYYYWNLYSLKKKYDTQLGGADFADYLTEKNIISQKLSLAGYPEYLSTNLKILTDKLSSYNTNLIELMKFSFEHQELTNDVFPNLLNKFQSFINDPEIVRKPNERESLQNFYQQLRDASNNLAQASGLLSTFRDAYFELVNAEIEKYQRYLLELGQYYSAEKLNTELTQKIIGDKDVKKVFYKGSIFINPADISNNGSVILRFIKQ